MLEDGRTIVALATPEGRGGLAVVRLSGPGSVDVARRLVSGDALADPVASHRARLATLRWPADESGEGSRDILDQSLVLPMLAPASYTGEDTVEFSCHGGTMPARLVIDACLAAGARAATAGEFTRRAFLNGRLSLTEAEAVADLIGSEHAMGARAALSQLRGGLARRLEAIEHPLRVLLAEVEGALEFADDEFAPPDEASMGAVIAAARRDVAALLDLAPAGRRLRDGVQVALVGAPNAGKSSLFNALVGEDRVIVDPLPGTTRDTIEAELDLGGIRFVLHDTAGLRERGERLEALGMDRTRTAVAGADIVLVLEAADGSAAAPVVESSDDARIIRITTKGDLAPGASGLVTSSVTGQGLADLRDAILRTARDGGLDAAAAAGVMLNQRQGARLRSAAEGLAGVEASLAAGPEVVASGLAAVLRDLGGISGRVFSERMLGEVFSRFCVGK